MCFTGHMYCLQSNSLFPVPGIEDITNDMDNLTFPMIIFRLYGKELPVIRCSRKGFRPDNPPNHNGQLLEFQFPVMSGRLYSCGERLL